MSSPASPSRPAPALVAVDEALGIMDPEDADVVSSVRAGASGSSSSSSAGSVVGASHHADGLTIYHLADLGRAPSYTSAAPAFSSTHHLPLANSGTSSSSSTPPSSRTLPGSPASPADTTASGDYESDEFRSREEIRLEVYARFGLLDAFLPRWVDGVSQHHVVASSSSYTPTQGTSRRRAATTSSPFGARHYLATYQPGAAVEDGRWRTRDEVRADVYRRLIYEARVRNGGISEYAMAPVQRVQTLSADPPPPYSA